MYDSCLVSFLRPNRYINQFNFFIINRVHTSKISTILSLSSSPWGRRRLSFLSSNGIRKFVRCSRLVVIAISIVSFTLFSYLKYKKMTFVVGYIMAFLKLLGTSVATNGFLCIFSDLYLTIKKDIFSSDTNSDK